MKRYILIIFGLLLILIISSSYGKTSSSSKSKSKSNFKLDVQYNRVNYTLTLLEKKTLTYRDAHFSQSFTLKKCNKTMLSTFLTSLYGAKNGTDINPPPFKKEVTVYWNDTKKSYSFNSLFGTFLTTIPRIILNLSIRNRYRCVKK